MCFIRIKFYFLILCVMPFRLCSQMKFYGDLNGGEHMILGHMGSAAVAANSVAQVARQLCDSCIVWVVQRGGDLSWKDDRREKDRVCESICKRFLILSIIMGILGVNCDS